MMRACTFVLGVLLFAWSTRTAAQSGDAQLPESYLAIKASLGFAGAAKVHNDAHSLTQNGEPNPIVIPERDSASDLKTTIGGEAQYVFSVHRYFGIGALLGMRMWRSANSELANEGTSFNFDFGVAPQLRLPLSPRLEVYVAVPLSLVLSVLREHKTWSELPNAALGTAASASPAYGFALGALAGARFAIGGTFGVLAEVGYQRYAFTHDVQFHIREELDAMGLGTTLELDVVTEQLRVNVGVFF